MSSAYEYEWRLNVIILCSSFIMIIGTVFCLTIKKLYCRSRNDLISIYPPIKLFAITEMICYLLSYTVALLRNVIFSNSNTFHGVLYGLFVLWLIFGLISSYLFIVYRYYFTFIDSTFAMKRHFLYFHTFVVISIPSYLIFALYFYYIGLYIFVVSSCIFGISLAFIAYSLLIYGFNHNLFKLVLKHRQEITITVNNNNNKSCKPSLGDQKLESSSLNTHQLFMIQQITKQTLLGSIHVGCILIIIIVCILFIIINHFIYIDITIFMIIFSWTVTLTIIVGVISVYLSFIFNANIYHFICGHCHFKCRAFCESLAEKQIETLSKEDDKRKNDKNNSNANIIELQVHDQKITETPGSEISISLDIEESEIP